MSKKIQGLIAMIAAHYSLPDNGGGGSLHIATDDGNLDDDSINFCIRYAKENGDFWGEWLARAMLALTEEERIEAYRWYWDHGEP